MKKGKTPSLRPVGIDLFCGAGGLSLGFEQAGFDIVAAVDLDPIHCATHEFNFPNSATICANASLITGRDIRERANLEHQKVDVVFGGAPCQGFSMMGKRALDDPRNRLVGEFLRLVVELEANYFVFENVKGLTVGTQRRFLEEVIEAFSDRGYNVVDPYRVLNAAEFGVPQDRHRLFLLGARRGLRLPRYPAPTHQQVVGKQKLIALSEAPTVWDAIRDVPEADAFPELLTTDSVKARFGRPSNYARRMRGIQRDRDDFSHKREFDRSVLTSSLRTEHTELSRSRFRATKHGETEPISRFLKLDPKGVCNTLRAGTATDRGAFTSPRPIHPHTPRCLTVREAARLHSYPDWFRFHVTKWHGFRQIGNSVPPLLARAVASAVLRALGSEPQVPPKSIALGDPGLLSLNMACAASRYGVPADIIPQRIRIIDEERRSERLANV